MIRTLLFLLAAALVARASEPISAPFTGATDPVKQPHVVADMIPEKSTITPGEPFYIALHLKSDPGWHTYWINPGDAGLATTIKWTLPKGFTAGPIQWPTPEKHNMGPLVTYGYEGDVYLLTAITPPKGDLPQHFDIKAKASWLVCQEACIPGKAEFTLTLDSGMLNLRLPVDNKEFFAAALERMPVPNTLWDVKASYGISMGSGDRQFPSMSISLTPKPGMPKRDPGHVLFFPEQPNVLATIKHRGGWEFDYIKSSGVIGLMPDLQQNGEQPTKLSGVLVGSELLIGTSKSVQIAEFSVTGKAELIGSVATTPSTSGNTVQGSLNTSLSGSPQATGGSDQVSATPTAAQRAATTAQPLLLGVLGAAFLGGLILNLMPCVLPVLSLKVFSLTKHAGENPKRVWIQGVAFTVGVVLSFWVLAGLLLTLRSAGNHLGWGFQMQSPGFVFGLIMLFFLLGLNLFGVFELGASLVGLDAKASSHVGGTASSFLNGALATVAATPCTAPFMGSALGFAAQQSAFISLLIFTFLALGMAAPYLLLTLFPGALKFVPKPGAWMEAFKQFMGFLLMATVIFLVYVFGALVGEDQVPWLLFILLISGIGAWVYGKWGTPFQSGGVRFAAIVIALLLVGLSISWGVTLAGTPRLARGATSEGWQTWSPEAVTAALDKGQPVFVDFTAAWCLSCKVNERVALGTDAVKKAFADKNVALFKADWTNSDPEISKTLQQFNRDGVPLYLVYSPKDKAAPQVLPEVLTPGIVLDALNKL